MIDDMISGSIEGSITSPRVTGDVDIARFPSSSGGADRWRVSIAGQVHFLADVDTARRIYSLSSGSTYASTYRSYVELAGVDACTFETYIAWSERHREQLEGLVTTPDGHPLKLRHQLISEALCQRIARPLTWLFHRLPAAVLLLASVMVVAAYVLSWTGRWQGTFWFAVPLAFLGIFVHEIGHITACVRHGARQGGIGIGLYWIWPAFYADVRGSWALSARYRLQVSAGGLYFQSLYAALLAVLGMATGNPTFGMAVQITLLLMATTCNPVFKYDGYWILADLFNITNVHKNIAEYLARLIHGDAASRKGLLRTRWMWLSGIFVLAATGYMTYIGAELFLSGSSAWQRLVGEWQSPRLHDGSRWPHWFATASLSVQLTLIGLAFVILGMRSLQATTAILHGRRGGDGVRIGNEGEETQPTTG